MKSLLSLAFLLLVLNLNAQLIEDVKVVIVACKSGDLYIDGVKIATIGADDAHQEKISIGEHYLQLKAGAEKYSLTLNINQQTKDIVKIGCSINPADPHPIKIIEKELYLASNLVTPVADQNLVGLDTGDEIVLNCDVVNKKGTANISIKEIETGREIYRREGFESIISERIQVPAKGIYIIDFSTYALLGKNLKFSIARIPGLNSNPYFKTTVKRSYDTSFVEVLNTTTRVYSLTNFSNPNKTAIKINLPANATYWAYWIGVDQEASQSMKNFAIQCSKIGGLLSSNPLVLFGMKLIPSLPIVNSTSTISYKFMDTRNSQAFVTGKQYSYFTFKHADNISTDFALIDKTAQDLVISFENNSTSIGKDVDIKVVAFTVKPKLVIEE